MSGLPIKIKDLILSKLTFENPRYTEAKARGNSLWGIEKYIRNYKFAIDNRLIIPRGFKLELYKILDREKICYKIIDMRKRFDFIDVDSRSIKLPSFQYEALSKIAYIAEEGLIVSPAASGKTVMGISLIPILGQPTLWLTHTHALLKQVMERIHKFLPKMNENSIGTIENGKWNIGTMFTAGLIASVREAPDRLYNQFGLVILDEAHHSPAYTFKEVINHLNPYFLYGLTATPYRGDKLERIMFQILGPMLVQTDRNVIIAKGNIVNPIVIYSTISSKVDYSSDFNKIIRDKIVKNHDRNCIITADVIAEATLGNYCIVLTDRKIHAEILYDLIKIGWSKTGIATGKYNPKHIDKSINDLICKKITVLVCTFSLLGEGFDVNFLNRAFVACPFRSEGKTEQLIGRIQRPAEGKKNAVLYEYVDVDIGLLKDQFYSKKSGRLNKYRELGLVVMPANVEKDYENKS